jgi:hypothetical protein
MSSSALLRLEALRKCNTDPNWVNADLYRLLYKTDLYVVAYEKIKSAPGPEPEASARLPGVPP